MRASVLAKKTGVWLAIVLSMLSAIYLGLKSGTIRESQNLNQAEVALITSLHNTVVLADRLLREGKNDVLITLFVAYEESNQSAVCRYNLEEALRLAVEAFDTSVEPVPEP